MTASEPGITRRRSGRGFNYRDPAGVTITDPRVLDRIRALAVPPAWRDVWISPKPGAQLQAIGIDARGRKQYRYQERFRAARDALKFGRLARFGQALPRLRRRVRRDLAAEGLPRERVLAALVRILDRTALRVGGETYARENGSYGLTTLRRRHVRVQGDKVELVFRGKGKKAVRVVVDDAAVAAVVRRCRKAGAKRVFVWRGSDRSLRTVTDAHVNRYIRQAVGSPHSAKDFRTWAATVAAARALRDRGSARSDSPAQRKHLLVTAVAVAAQEIGDTPAVTRNAYVHPRVLDALEAGRTPRVRARKRSGQRADEALTMAVLRAHEPDA